MRKTAFILAGAVAFDLGVMAVSAQAQQAGQPAPRAADSAGPDSGEVPRSTGVTETPGARGNGFVRGDLSQRGGDPAPRQQAAVDLFIKLSEAYPARACTAARGQIVRHQGAQQCRLPAPAGQGDPQDFRIEGHIGVAGDTAGASNRRAGPDATAGDSDYFKYGAALNFTKIDVTHTARACIAQRGQVVTREGVQQCALPNAAPDRARERSAGASAVARE